MSRFVFKGPSAQITVHNPSVMFRRGVPTWAPLPLRDRLPYEAFEPYDVPLLLANQQSKHTTRDKLLIHVSRKPETMFGLVPFLQRLREKYPTCDIHVCGDTTYADFIAPHATMIESYKPQEAQKYYRHWMLTGGGADAHLNLLQLAHHPWWRMALMYLNLNDEVDIEPVKTAPPIANRWICIVKNGVNGAETWEGMGEWLAISARNAGYAVRTIEAFDPSQLKSQLDDVTDASLFVACGYSPLIYAAGWSGIPSFCLMPANTPTSRIAEGQFKLRPDWFFTHIGTKDPASGVGELVWAEVNRLARIYKVGTAANGVNDAIESTETSDDSGSESVDNATGRSFDNGNGSEPARSAPVWRRMFGSNDTETDAD